MSVSCGHNAWEEVNVFSSGQASRLRCRSCARTVIAKSRVYVDPYYRPIAGNEFAAYRLLELLAQRGVEIRSAQAEAVRYFALPWPHSAVLITDLGPCSRVSSTDAPDGARWPSWLYDFDRWIGRLDGDGDTNILLLPDGAIVPVDWGMAFTWAARPPHTVKLQELDVPAHPMVAKARDPLVRSAIAQISDADIWRSMTYGIPEELLPAPLQVSYFNGLVVRRDLLAAEWAREGETHESAT